MRKQLVFSIHEDSSRCRAPTAADTDSESIEACSLSHGPPGRRRCTVALPREDRARAAVKAGPLASTELRRSRTVPLRRTQSRQPARPLARLRLRIRLSLDDHVPARPRTQQLIPTRPLAGRGDQGRHVPLHTSPPGHGLGRHVPLTNPRGPEAKRPPSRPGRRDLRGHVTIITSGPP